MIRTINGRKQAMGYELHITRANHWLDADATPITLPQWREFAASEPRLIEDGWMEWEDIGRQPIYNLTTCDGDDVSFTWRNGEVTISGWLSNEACQEIVELAAALGANLVGDDGETYTS